MLAAAILLAGCKDGAGTVDNPVPSLSSAAPAQLTAAMGAAEVTLTGNGFASASQARWNGADRPTTVISSRQIRVSLLESDLATAGSGELVVHSPAPGGGTSGAIVVPIVNPVPTIISISPDSISALTPLVLTVRGHGFVEGAAIHIREEAATTRRVSSTELTTDLNVRWGSVFPVTVVNPTPGGGVSTEKHLVVTNPVPIVTELHPTFLHADGRAQNLMVLGSRFTRPHLLWNDTTLTAPLPFSDDRFVILVPGERVGTVARDVVVRLQNPPPGGGISETLILRIGPRP